MGLLYSEVLDRAQRETKQRKGEIMTMVKARDWQTANCPICGKAFDYLPTYRPTTCGAFTCIQEAVKRKLIPPSEPYSGVSYR